MEVPPRCHCELWRSNPQPCAAWAIAYGSSSPLSLRALAKQSPAVSPLGDCIWKLLPVVIASSGEAIPSRVPPGRLHMEAPPRCHCELWRSNPQPCPAWVIAYGSSSPLSLRALAKQSPAVSPLGDCIWQLLPVVIASPGEAIPSRVPPG